MFRQYDDKNSINRKRARYYSGGKTDVFSNSLGWWERDTENLTRHIDDISYLITKDKEFKPWLVSFDVYNTVELEWLVLSYNNIVDINEEFTTNTILTLPSYTRAIFQIAVR